jgi:Dolichyl-phosphate-mannose-protein mannosyltransferase
MMGVRARSAEPTTDPLDEEIAEVEDHRTRQRRRMLVSFAVLAIVGVALYVRLIHLTALGFNSDEAVYTGQAGALAGVGDYARNFSPFRAHPLLLQTILAMEFTVLGHMSEFMSRATVVVTGVAAVFSTYLLGRRMFGIAVGLAAAAALAIMPYHVFISRQVLLDVPAGLAVLLAFAALYRYDGPATRRWLYLAAALGGIGCVIKETMIVFAPAALVYLAWSKILKRTRVRDIVLCGALMLVMLAPFISTRFLFSGSGAGGYIIYQLFRPPNHPAWYFPVVFWIFITPVATLAIAYGIVLACIRRTRADKLLLSWLAAFGALFQFWPTKLLPYAVILVPAMAIVGARGLVDLFAKIRERWSTWVAWGAAAVMALAVLGPMIGPASRAGNVIRDSSFSGPLTTDVEVQDFAGGRETGQWFANNTPSDAVAMTMGPSLGNLVSFYGDRDFYALSVSNDPKLRNPAYRPIPNPDFDIRQIEVQYAVWDAYTADRAPFFSTRLMSYVQKYSGTPVFSVWVEGNKVAYWNGPPPTSAELRGDVRIVVYQLVGGDPLVNPTDQGEAP